MSKPTEPTKAQLSHVEVVEREVTRVLAEWLLDGASLPVVITGGGMALTNLIVATGSKEKAVKWLRRQAVLVENSEKHN